MVRVSRLLRDYREAGALNELIALWGFATEAVFLTKAGHVGTVYRFRGIDPEGLTREQQEALTHRFGAALHSLDHRCRLYQYLVKRAAPEIPRPPCQNPVADEAIARRVAFLNDRRGDMSEVEIYAVLVYEAPSAARRKTRAGGLWRSPRQTLRAWLMPSETIALLERELERALQTLEQKARAFEVHCQEFGVERLHKSEAFRFFRALANGGEPGTAAGDLRAPDVHLDYFVGDCTIECHRDHLSIGPRVLRVVSMKEPPAQTFAFLLKDLCRVPGEFVACLEWKRTPADRVRRDIQTRRRHFFNKRISIVNYVAPDTRPDEMLIDESATATVAQLGQALTDIEVNGHFFGECSFTIVLYGNDTRTLERHASEVAKVLAVHDGAMFNEAYNLLNAWLSVIPGNAAYNVRRLALLETHAADLSFLFTIDGGDRTTAHLGREAVAVFETPHRVPYAFSLHVADVGHTLVLGATGSGKSFLLNCLITHAQKYEPRTVVLDIGHSYRKLATLLGGSYVAVGDGHRSVTINPFALSRTPENIAFLHGFVRVLIEGADGYRLGDAEDRELYEAIENVYVLDREQRRLQSVASLLPRAVAVRLRKWIDGGRYAGMFDNVDDSVAIAPLQVFDFESMNAYPDVIEPLLFYILHRVATAIRNPSTGGGLNLCVIDEAWRFIQHPMLRGYVHEGLKTWRKHNAAMILATQTIDDFASADLLRTAVESCPTTLFLANPGFDQTRYAELFGLNEAELDLLVGLQPRHQFLLKRQGLAKVLNLTVDARSYWIYTNTPLDNAKVAALCREFGLEGGLDRLVASA